MTFLMRRRRIACAWLGALLACAAARADLGPSLVVLDFTDASAYHNHALSRRAADAVALAIKERALWDVLPRKQVRRELKSRGLAPPLSAAHGQLIADVLGAQHALIGTVLKCDVDEALRSVQVDLRARVVNKATGKTEESRSATATVKWGAMETPILDAQVSAAITQAAEAVVEQMRGTQTPAGPGPAASVPAPPIPEVVAPAPLPETRTGAAPWVAPEAPKEAVPTRTLEAHVVMTLSKKRVLLDLGARKGAQKGMVFTIERAELDRETGRPRKVYVARLKIVKVSPRDSEAEIIDILGPIQQLDVARAVVPLNPKKKKRR